MTRLSLPQLGLARPPALAGGVSPPPPAPVAALGTPTVFKHPSGIATSWSFSGHTHAGGTNAGLIAVLGARGLSGDAAWSLSWNGAAFTKAIELQNTGTAQDARLLLAWLATPSTGAFDLVLDSAVDIYDAVVALFDATAMHQTAPIGQNDTHYETTGSHSTSSTSITGHASSNLVLSAATINLGTGCSVDAGFGELVDTTSDGGTGTSTTTLAIASRTGNTDPIAPTWTFGGSDNSVASFTAELVGA